MKRAHIKCRYSSPALLLGLCLSCRPVAMHLLLVVMHLATSSFLLLVAMPFVPSSFLLLVARPGPTNSVLVSSSDALSYYIVAAIS